MNTQNKLFAKLCTEDALYEAWKVIKSKKSNGGVDGVTLSLYEEDIQENLKELLNELKSGTWEPEPYLSVSIPKKNNEMRKLGMLSVKDKIVQHAIKTLIEPVLENLFVDQSYAYRPNKGHTKAIRRVQSECQKKKNKWALRLDIDDYFDNICHQQLAALLHKLFPNEEEMVRLIMLSVEMGLVNKRLKWDDRFCRCAFVLRVVIHRDLLFHCFISVSFVLNMGSFLSFAYPRILLICKHPSPRFCYETSAVSV